MNFLTFGVENVGYFGDAFFHGQIDVDGSPLPVAIFVRLQGFLSTDAVFLAFYSE